MRLLLSSKILPAYPVLQCHIHITAAATFINDGDQLFRASNKAVFLGCYFISTSTSTIFQSPATLPFISAELKRQVLCSSILDDD